MQHYRQYDNLPKKTVLDDRNNVVNPVKKKKKKISQNVDRGQSSLWEYNNRRTLKELPLPRSLIII